MKRTRIIIFAIFLVCSLSSISVAADSDVNIDCDIQEGSCIRNLDNNTSIEFDIQPKPVAAMTDLTFHVTIKQNGKPVENASLLLDLSMPGMFMGKNQPMMKHTKNGVYEGHGVIVRCMSGRKTWKADVSATASDHKTSAAFIFEVK